MTRHRRKMAHRVNAARKRISKPSSNPLDVDPTDPNAFSSSLAKSWRRPIQPAIERSDLRLIRILALWVALYGLFNMMNIIIL